MAADEIENMPEPEPEDEGTVLFEERFDRCTLTEGPAIQSDNFKDDCENPLSHISFKSTVWKTVGTSHVCSNEYLNSRGFAPWVYLFRVSERPGHLACGVNGDGKRQHSGTRQMAARTFRCV